MRHSRFILALLILAPFLPSELSAAEEPEPGAQVIVERAAPVDEVKPAALRGPVDGATYIVGPGDRFTITVWGPTVMSTPVMVVPDGDLVVPGVASIPVSGITLDEARVRITEELSRVYRNVDFSISLTGLRRIRVNVLGEVENPGAYTATALETASDLIQRAGGLLDPASRRNITVTRRSGGTRRVDLTRYAQAGDVEADAPILDGDVVYVPHMVEYVHVLGAVARPGRYEYVEGETAWSLVELAGGLERAAVPDSSELRRFVDDRTTEGRPVDLTSEAGRGAAVMPADQLYVPSRPDWRRAEFVRVDGEVRFPGHYGINEGSDRASDVIRRAGGPTEWASLRDALIIRLRSDDKPDPELERLNETPFDRMTEMEYAYLKTRYRQDKRSVVVDFEALLSGEEAEDPLLRHNDRIVFPKAQQTVLVSGQVMMPGHVPYEPNERYTRYIDLVGGYTDDANRSRVMVIRDETGHQFRAGRAKEIFPGDEIWVPEEPDEGWWDNARDIVAFISSVATIYLVIDQAANN
ncbi:MAG: hypothetical protein GF400_08890 [Candidatus Eisenbacteria bacterium]|nr:hypothetical protein [Candidatus Eisenbacteria bacterium]